MGAGFVYILINASMPGVVKVGKTERDPEGRAKELSGVTGVPTPFVVVYHEVFDDCSVAEAYVHTLLEAKGYRVATNREFFSAPAQVVIQALIQAKTALRGNVDGEEAATSDAPTPSSAILQSEPWEGIVASAEAARWGLGNTIQDLAEAARLYQQAAKLGSAEACYLLGNLHRSGDIPGANDAEALRWLNEGARRGYAPCYAKLATFYLVQGHLPNAGKCWAKYREACAGHGDDGYWREAFFYLAKAADRKVTVPEIESFWRDREEILGWGEQYAAGGGPGRLLMMYQARYVLRSERNLMRGIVRFWSEEDGGGFVTGDDGHDAYLSLQAIVEGDLPPTVGQPVAFAPITVEGTTDGGRRLAFVARLLPGLRRRKGLSREDASEVAKTLGLSSQQLLDSKTYQLSDIDWKSMAMWPASYFPRDWNQAEEQGNAAQMMKIASFLARAIDGQLAPW